MKNTVAMTVLIGLMTAFSQFSQAHPGHDHSHWSSDPIHIITLAIVGSVLTGAFVYNQFILKPKKQKQQEAHHDA
ncbi:hypothetical protein [Marinomonas sp. 2405UD68-3]|uniref:hypothetical protein n=1 Tax=Marinomonas sp. 2405UD68-3 TaxID=3391835 RepID=UPI0039C94657